MVTSATHRECPLANGVILCEIEMPTDESAAERGFKSFEQAHIRSVQIDRALLSQDEIEALEKRRAACNEDDRDDY